MAYAMRGLKEGLTPGLDLPYQLDTQADAVTASTYTASGAIAEADSVVDLNSAGAKLEMTIARPRAGRLLVITQIDAGTQGHTVTLTAGTWDLTGNTIATLNAQYEAIVVLGISDRRFLILKNYGSVVFS